LISRLIFNKEAKYCLFVFTSLTSHLFQTLGAYYATSPCREKVGMRVNYKLGSFSLSGEGRDEGELFKKATTVAPHPNPLP